MFNIGLNVEHAKAYIGKLKVEQIAEEWDILFNGKFFEAIRQADQKDIDKFIDMVLGSQDDRGAKIMSGIRGKGL